METGSLGRLIRDADVIAFFYDYAAPGPGFTAVSTRQIPKALPLAVLIVARISVPTMR